MKIDTILRDLEMYVPVYSQNKEKFQRISYCYYLDKTQRNMGQIHWWIGLRFIKPAGLPFNDVSRNLENPRHYIHVAYKTVRLAFESLLDWVMCSIWIWEAYLPWHLNYKVGSRSIVKVYPCSTYMHALKRKYESEDLLHKSFVKKILV